MRLHRWPIVFFVLKITVLLICSVLMSVGTKAEPLPPDLPPNSAAHSLPSQGLTPDSFANIYSLQALIDFDTLEGAQYDPSSRTLVLFGRRGQADRLLNVTYLDLLATALEANEPTLTLNWTSESQREIAIARQNSSTFFNIFEQTSPLDPPDTRRINALGAWLFGQAGLNVAAGADINDVGPEVERRGASPGYSPARFRCMCRLRLPLSRSRQFRWLIPS